MIPRAEREGTSINKTAGACLQLACGWQQRQGQAGISTLLLLQREQGGGMIPRAGRGFRPQAHKQGNLHQLESAASDTSRSAQRPQAKSPTSAHEPNPHCCMLMAESARESLTCVAAPDNSVSLTCVVAPDGSVSLTCVSAAGGSIQAVAWPVSMWAVALMAVPQAPEGRGGADSRGLQADGQAGNPAHVLTHNAFWLTPEHFSELCLDSRVCCCWHCWLRRRCCCCHWQVCWGVGTCRRACSELLPCGRCARSLLWRCGCLRGRNLWRPAGRCGHLCILRAAGGAAAQLHEVLYLAGQLGNRSLLFAALLLALPPPLLALPQLLLALPQLLLALPQLLLAACFYSGKLSLCPVSARGLLSHLLLEVHVPA